MVTVVATTKYDTSRTESDCGVIVLKSSIAVKTLPASVELVVVVVIVLVAVSHDVSRL